MRDFSRSPLIQFSGPIYRTASGDSSRCRISKINFTEAKAFFVSGKVFAIQRNIESESPSEGAQPSSTSDVKVELGEHYELMRLVVMNSGKDSCTFV